MTSTNVVGIGPNVMVNPKMNDVKDDDNSVAFLDVMNKNVAKSDRDVTSTDINSTLKTSDKRPQDVKDSKAAAKYDDTSAKDNKVKSDKSDKKDNVNVADKTDKTKNVKSDKANAADDTKDAGNIEELPIETIELVNEVINNFSADVKDVLIQALDITEDELTVEMADLGITFADLLNPKQVTELLVEVTDVEDSVSMVLDENLSDALSAIRDLGEQVVADTGLEAPVIRDVIADNEGGIEIPPEMMGQDADVDLEELPEMPQDRPVRDDNLVNRPVMTDDEPVQAEETAEEEIPVVVNREYNESDEELNDDSINVNDNTAPVKEPQNSSANSSNNFTRGERHDDTTRQFNMTATVDNQNVQVEAPVEVEARPQVNRFETMQLISQIAEAARANISQEVTSLEMILNPESLGRIYLNVSQKQGNLHAQLIAQNEAVKEALEAQIAELKENLNKAGIKVQAVEVSVGTHEFERNLEEGMQNQDEQARQQEEQASGTRKRVNINLNNLDEMQGLMSDEDMLVAQMMRDQGNSMNLQA